MECWGKAEENRNKIGRHLGVCFTLGEVICILHHRSVFLSWVPNMGAARSQTPAPQSDTSFNLDHVVGLLLDSMEIALLFTLENCFQTSVSF